MAWGFAWLWSKKEQPLSQEQKERLQRRCKAFLSGLEGCRRANPGSETSIACKHLEQRVVTCFAETHAPEAADEHKRCYTKLFKAGHYKGLTHCKPYEEDMKKVLQGKGLYPI